MDYPVTAHELTPYTGHPTATGTEQSTRRSNPEIDVVVPAFTFGQYLKLYKKGDYGPAPPPLLTTPELDKLNSKPDAPTTISWELRPEHCHVYNVKLTPAHPAMMVAGIDKDCTYTGY